MANHPSVLTALADPTRREIFERLALRPLVVGALARGLPVRRPDVSQHLKVLKGAGLVTDRAEATRRVYADDPEGLVAIRNYFEQCWQLSLAAFRDAPNPPFNDRHKEER